MHVCQGPRRRARTRGRAARGTGRARTTSSLGGAGAARPYYTRPVMRTNPNRDTAARLRAVLPLLLVLAAPAGCATLRNPDAVSARVGRLRGTSYEQETSWQVGRQTFALLKRASGAGTGSPADAATLAGIDEIRFGTYRAKGTPRVSSPLRLEDFRGYDPLASRQSRSGDGILLLSRGPGTRVKEVLLIVDGRERLAVVQVRGELTGLLDRVGRLALDHADRPDLAEEFGGVQGESP